MGKLLELLNDWERERVNHNTKEFIPYSESSFSDLSVERITSKKYGFIKRLVDGNNIDFKKMYEKVGKPQIIMYAERNKEEELCEIIGENERSYYEDILMLLAIQDSPLEFLADILK